MALGYSVLAVSLVMLPLFVVGSICLLLCRRVLRSRASGVERQAAVGLLRMDAIGLLSGVSPESARAIRESYACTLTRAPR